MTWPPGWPGTGPGSRRPWPRSNTIRVVQVPALPCRGCPMLALPELTELATREMLPLGINLGRALTAYLAIGVASETVVEAANRFTARLAYWQGRGVVAPGPFAL